MAEAKKIGLDDYRLDHSLEELLALPTIDLDDPKFAGLEQSYLKWKLTGTTTVEDIGFRNLTDLGNGERLALRERDEDGQYRIHYSNDVGWRYWDDTYWRTDTTSEIGRRAVGAVRLIHSEASKARDKEEAKALGSWAIKSEAAGKISAMVEMARLVPGISVESDVWDKNPWLLNLKNGTFDLEHQTLNRHQRDDFITKYIDLAYNPAATCPLWLSFLNRIIPNQETLNYVQRAVGYSLSGSTREHCFFILYGTGANGKSTFLDVIREMLAGYGGVMRAESLMVQNNSGGGANPDIAALRGLRFVSSSETDEGKRLAEGLLKEMSGNRTIKARFLYKDEFEFEPTFKIWLAVNHLPRIRGTDEGIWRRLKRIPFSVSIPTDQQDKTLVYRLLLELPGILAWAMEGYRSWAAIGIGDCEEVNSATKEYREQSDSLKSFIDDCCIIGLDRFVEKADLYEKYSEWAKKSGEYPLSKTMFGTRISERGFQGRKSGKWFWDGIGLAGGTIDQESWLTN
jgi:putative DNA primase/helicase